VLASRTAATSPPQKQTPKVSQKAKKSVYLPRSWSIELTAGSGFDSNPTRVEAAGCGGRQKIPSAFILGSLNLEGQWRFSHTDRLQIGLLGGTKIHLSDAAKGEDVYKHQLSAAWTHLFPPHSALVFRGLYFDSWERTFADDDATDAEVAPPELQDFRYLRAEAAYVARFASALVGSATLAAARFTYAPDPRLGYTGWGAAMNLRYRHRWGPQTKPSQLTLDGNYAIEGHRYPRNALSSSGPTRHDLLHTVFLEVAYVGPLLASLAYTLKANISNDTAWSVIRHTATLKTAVSLPASLVAVAKATYQHLEYSGALLLYTPTAANPFQQLDAESRSSVLVSLSRDLSDIYAVSLSYKIYLGKANQPCADFYIRHLVTLEAIVRFESS
jgi:hypothetical protein